MRMTLAYLLCTLHAAGGTPDKPQLRRFEYEGTEMATPVKMVAYSNDEALARRAVNAAFERIRGLNSTLSDYQPESELSRLCRSGTTGEKVPVSDDLFRVLSRADELSRLSTGAFDVTVGPLVRLWRRARRVQRLPTEMRRREAMALVDYRRVELDPTDASVRLLKPGLRIDLGGIAKGYAADEALSTLRHYGLCHALVDVGGDIAMGTPPPGRPGWRIRITRGDDLNDSRRDLWLPQGGVATSGDTEQFVIIDGRRYSHIVDPRTGLGLTDRSCVTVLAPDATTADALASAVSVLGPRDGMALIEKTPGVAGRIVRRPVSGTKLYESTNWTKLQSFEGELLLTGLANGPLNPESRETGDPADNTNGKATTRRGEEAAAAPGQTLAPPKSVAPTTKSAKSLDPTVTPPVAWLLEALPLPEARASSPEEMKPYTERIPGTEVTFEMVPIPGGTFRMGSAADEPKRTAAEGPQFDVELEPFWMGKCEVTWEEYELWGMGYDAQREKGVRQISARDHLADAITRPTKPYSDMTFGMGRERHPAICMTQLAAKVYCKWLSAKTGRFYRLPTEAEWEYAARAGTTTVYSFGDDPKVLGEYAWYYDNSDERYHPVGKKKPNPWGLYDMHGNVAEWVLDAFSPESYQRFAGKRQRNPLVVPTDIYPRVARGGSWNDDPDMLRCAARQASSADWKMGDPQIPQSIWYHTEAAFVGFRVVRPLRLPAAEEAKRYDVDEAQKAALADYLEFLAGKE